VSTYTSRSKFDLEWMERWARLVNDDRRLPVFGRFFSGRFVVVFDDREYLVTVFEGKIRRVSEGVGFNDFGYEFGFKASTATWSKFCQQTPPPMFNDIWAMHGNPREPSMEFLGNQMTFLQNIRAVTRMIDLMRDV